MSLDNPIAQNLLIKQLQRYHLNIIATGNGEEAIAGESQPCSFKRIDIRLFQSGRRMNPDFFLLPYLTIVGCLLNTSISVPTLTTFNQDMPICDGVEAAKRLRLLESKLNVPVILPSKGPSIQDYTSR